MDRNTDTPALPERPEKQQEQEQEEEQDELLTPEEEHAKMLRRRQLVGDLKQAQRDVQAYHPEGREKELDLGIMAHLEFFLSRQVEFYLNNSEPYTSATSKNADNNGH